MTLATERTLAALSPLPDEDAALAELASGLAASIDGMSAEERVRLIGQVAPALTRVLAELDARARRRRGPGAAAEGASPLDELRAARSRRRS